MTNIIIQPEDIKALVDCVVDIIQNKIDWQTIDWQSVAEKAAERPKGEWIADDEWGNCHCSICRFENNHQPNFCENCGSNMRGDI